MRTKRIKLYKFEELSTEAKQKAIKWWQKVTSNNGDGLYNSGYIEEILTVNEYEFLSDGTIYNES